MAGNFKLKFKFTPLLIFNIYDLYANGKTDKEVADFLGLKHETYLYRKENHPGAAAAAKYGRRKHREAKSNRQEFDDLVIGKLPVELKAIWKRLKEEARNPTGFTPVQHMEMRNKQILWVHAWVKSNFSVQKACKFLNIPQQTVGLWKQQAPFKKLMEGMIEIKKDFIEDALLGLIHRQNPMATVFAAKTQLKDRGYGEETKITGKIEHTHEVTQTIDLTKLDLPLDVQMVIIDAIERQKKMENEPQPLLLEN